MVKVACAGLYQSGSTRLYNTVLFILEARHQNIATGFYKTTEFRSIAKSTPACIKFHGCPADLTKDASWKVVLSVRHIADTIHSMRQRKAMSSRHATNAEYVKKQLQIYQLWSKRDDTLVIPYKHFSEHPINTCIIIAKHIGVTDLTREEAVDINSRVEDLRRKILGAESAKPASYRKHLLTKDHLHGGKTGAGACIDDFDAVGKIVGASGVENILYMHDCLPFVTKKKK